MCEVEEATEFAKHEPVWESPECVSLVGAMDLCSKVDHQEESNDVVVLAGGYNWGSVTGVSDEALLAIKIPETTPAVHNDGNVEPATPSLVITNQPQSGAVTKILSDAHIAVRNWNNSDLGDEFADECLPDEVLLEVDAVEPGNRAHTALAHLAQPCHLRCSTEAREVPTQSMRRWHPPPIPPYAPGSMCPVEYGGTHVEHWN